MKFVVTILVITSLSVEVVRADFWFGYEKKPRPLDGKLQCYQCDSNLEAQNKVETPVCKMNRWKLANSTEKRNMMTYCPKRMSAFCMLVVDEHRTIRGCYGLHYKDRSRPHYGCFRMGEKNPYRVCLCNSNLCNGVVRLTAGRYLVVGFVLIVVYVAHKSLK